MSSVFAELKRTVISKRFVWTLTVLMFFVNSTFLIDSYTGNNIDVFLNVLWFGNFTRIAPLFCIIPAVMHYCEEQSTLIYRFIESRNSKRIVSDIHAKILAAGISGGIILALCIISIAIICRIGYPIFDSTSTSQLISFLTAGMFEDIYPSGNGIFFIMIQILMGFVFGFLWSLIGLVISIIFSNKYFCIAMTVIIYNVSNYCLRLNGLSAIAPETMLIPDGILEYSIGYLFVFQMILISITWIIGFKLYKRRYRYDYHAAEHTL